MNKSICFIVVLGVLTGALGRPGGDEANKEFYNKMSVWGKECYESENASPDDAAFFKKLEEPETKEGKCMIGCFYDKMGVMDNGAFSKTKADEFVQKSSFDDEKKEKLMKYNANCEKEIGSGNDKCETGVKIMKCFKKLRESSKE